MGVVESIVVSKVDALNIGIPKNAGTLEQVPDLFLKTKVAY